MGEEEQEKEEKDEAKEDEKEEEEKEEENKEEKEEGKVEEKEASDSKPASKCKDGQVATFAKSKTSHDLATADELKNSKQCGGEDICKLDFLDARDLCRLKDGQIGGKRWRYRLRKPAYSRWNF